MKGNDIMSKYDGWVKTKNGDYKKRILDYSSYINPISKKQELFTREDIGKMNSEEFNKNEEKIMMQMNSIGIPTNAMLAHSQSYDYEDEDDSDLEYIWILDDTKKVHCEICLDLEGTTYKREEDAPEIPVHDGCGCQLVPSIVI